MAEPHSSALASDAAERPDLALEGGVARLVRPPVFLHAGWRTAGTFLWSRFRALDGILGYYEPLHESLAAVSASTLARHGPLLWASGHPRLQRSYFDEFAPLFRKSAPGVRAYRREFATDDFFAGPDAAMPALEGYVRLLLERARAGNQQPVLKFCRSLGRAGWMTKSFPEAVHVAVMRDPVSQFISAKHQFVAHDNPYFLLMPLRVLARNASQARVAAALRHFAVRLPPGAEDDNPERANSVLGAHLRRSEPEAWYRGFLVFWLLGALGIPETIDAIIDANLLSLSPAYRAECKAELAVLSGVAVDLGGGASEACCTGRVADRLGCTQAELWRHHATAASFLAAEVAPDWANRFAPACVGTMLTYGTLLGMDPGHPIHAGALARGGEWEALAAYAERAAADGRRAQRRAERAERELAGVHRSRSWKVTSPLRLLGGRLRQAALMIGAKKS
jgi:hypothetical protein